MCSSGIRTGSFVGTMAENPTLIEADFNALLERALEIGANDMLDDGPQVVTTPIEAEPPAPAPPVPETAASA